MAELLVMAVSNHCPDPDKDRRGCYKRDDIVVVLEDRHRWGYDELLPPEQGGKFRIVKVPGVSADRLLRLIQRDRGVRLDAPLDKPGHGRLRRRRLSIDSAAGTLTLAQLSLALRDKAR